MASSGIEGMRIVIFGAGGFAKEVKDAVEACGGSVIGYVDESPYAQSAP